MDNLITAKEEISMAYEECEKNIRKPQKKKVAIVGFAPSFVETPWEDDSFEIWTLNEAYKLAEQQPKFRADRWFEIHNLDRPPKNDKKHIAWLQQCPVPLYTLQKWDFLPNAIPFPFYEISDWLKQRGHIGYRYFTNSISWIIAFAIMEGFEEIHIYGVDMAVEKDSNGNAEYCVSPETKVLTEDLRYIEAKNLTVGQKVIAFDEEKNTNLNRLYRVAEVEGVSVITRPCYKLYMEDGSTLVCSQEHRWLTGNGNNRAWMETKDLIAQDEYTDGRSSRIIKPLDVWEEDRSYEAGYIAASLDGEGHISQAEKPGIDCLYGMCVGYAQRANEMSEQFESAMQTRGYTWYKNKEISAKGDCFKYQIKGGRRELLRLLGTIRPPRLLLKFDASKLGNMRTGNRVRVLKKEFIGEQEVIALKTTTGTFIAEGFASHNSYQKPSCEYIIGVGEKYAKMYVPETSDLLFCSKMYAVEMDNKNAVFYKKQIDQLTQRLKQIDGALGNADKQAQNLEAQRHQIMGAVDTYKMLLRKRLM